MPWDWRRGCTLNDRRMSARRSAGWSRTVLSVHTSVRRTDTEFWEEDWHKGGVQAALDGRVVHRMMVTRATQDVMFVPWTGQGD